MASWQWIAALRAGKPNYDWRFVVRFGLKIIVGLIFINALWAGLNLTDQVEKLSLYNSLVPARPRPGYPLNLNEMLAASPISRSEAYQSEYRVIFLGDSAIWGVGLRWDHTVPECLNERALKTPDGRLIEAFNMAYPAPSMLRDLVTLQRALNYHVDHVIWFISGVGMDRYTLFRHALLQENLTDVYSILDHYPIAFPSNATPLPRFNDLSNLFNRTFVGQRDELRLWLQAQLDAFTWQQTHSDATEDYPPQAPRTFADRPELGLNYNPGLDLNRGPNEIAMDDFMFDSIAAGQSIADKAGAN